VTTNFTSGVRAVEPPESDVEPMTSQYKPRLRAANARRLPAVQGRQGGWSRPGLGEVSCGGHRQDRGRGWAAAVVEVAGALI
jgi:hypothetical protein